MKFSFRCFPFILLFFISCAGESRLAERAPEWLDTPLENTQDTLAFRGVGTGEKTAQARSLAIEDLFSNIVKSMDLVVDSETLTTAFKEELASLQKELDFALKKPSSSRLEGLTVVRQGAWPADDFDGVSYAIDVTWERTALFELSDRLVKTLRNDSPKFKSLMNRAEFEKTRGHGYESALIWASAAQVAEGNQNVAGLREAFRQISRIINGMTYKLESAPKNPTVGVRQTRPVVFQVELDGKPVENAEFIVSYPRKTREGNPARGTARIYSDGEGLVRFLPPEIPFSGVQRVTLAPSADPFDRLIENKDNAWMETTISGIETPRIEAVYEAVPRYLDASIGVALLETDLAGKPLSSFAAGGLIDILQKTDVNISLADLNPSELTSRSGAALLQTLKADKRISEKYDWIIHGKVSLTSFEQEGNTYVVRVEGTLILSDINRQADIYRSAITKNSRAEDGQQAINSAFRQIGRTFAEEIIREAP